MEGWRLVVQCNVAIGADEETGTRLLLFIINFSGVNKTEDKSDSFVRSIDRGE